MGCGCGGNRQTQVPKLPVNTTNNNTSSVVDAAKLHPSAVNLRNIQKLAEERRKLSMLKREQLLKALSKP